MDISTISTAYSAVKTIKEIGNSLLDAKIDSEAKKRVAEVLEKLGGVQDTLFYIREELLRVQDQNLELRKQVRDLEEKLNRKGNVVYRKPSYWITEDDAEDGPFCQRCFDEKDKLIRLQGGKNDVWSCHACTSTFYGPNYKPPTPQNVGVRRSKWMDGF